MPSPGPITIDAPEPKGEYDPDLPDSPIERPGFEIRAVSDDINFADNVGYTAEEASKPIFVPDYYPDTFRQTKGKKLERDGKQCQGEDITIDKIKNREFHAKGVMLEYEIGSFNQIADFNGQVEIISPMIPRGAMKCFVKSTEVGENQGYDAHAGQWLFKYTIDLVSTGKDEYRSDNGRNQIVSAVLGSDTPNVTEPSSLEDDDNPVDL